MLLQPPKVDLLQGLAAADKALFYQFGMGPTVNVPFKTVHHAFEHHARQQPDAIAVEDFEERITYGELDRRANCLAATLRERGVTADSRLCYVTERSIPLVVGILAILKAGAAYVPLDGNIVSDSTLKTAWLGSETPLILILKKFVHRLPNSQPIIYDDVICSSHNLEHCIKPYERASENHGCYVIYTSGTTGTPKGVDVTHGNVTNLVCLSPGNLGLKPGSRITQLMNISFDMAQWEILGSMSNGATLVLRGKSSTQWRAAMKTVDVVVATPSMLVPHKPEDYPLIKTIAVAGEPCPKSLADDWASRGVTFYNSCGPTEITIVNTMQDHKPGELLAIGAPCPNTSVYILDENMEPVPIGEVGVMWAGGKGITRGYINLPEKTAERYLPDPFMNDGSSMFNTGDLGRWTPEGSLEHLGRIDHQVKIKGFRVELDGVAHAMETFPAVQAAVALLLDGELWGFYTPANISSEDVKAAASKVQPYYAVPTRYLALEKFPHTFNGKTDRRTLEKLARDSMTEQTSDAETVAESNKPNMAAITEPTKPVSLSEPANLLAKELEQSFNEKNAADTTAASSITDIESSDSDSMAVIKRELPWSGYQDDYIPEKTQGKFARNLRHQIFSLYRRLFGVIFVTNMAIFISVCVKGANAKEIGGIVVANLFCAILMRQDHVINAFFDVFCSVPSSWPLAIRRVCARVYHIGGLHSGCATSGTIWLVLFAGQATREFVTTRKVSIATLTVTYIILALLIGIVIFAHPSLRSKKHNTFEAAHRFLGWIATAFVWAQFILLSNDYRLVGESLGHALVHAWPFWLIVVFTLSIILPWTKLRKVPVRAEVLSYHAVRLHFNYVTPIAGSFVRISDSPWTEWHGFATVPVPGKTGFSLIVSRAGDWTAKQISEPPTQMWVRGVPTFGVLRIVPLFRRMVIVATGSGIGPCTPCILEGRIPMRLLWTSPNVRETFGDDFTDTILKASPDAVIYDTRVHGKPDMVKLTYRLVKEFNAEAVAIISNQKLTQKVVYGMMSRGIPAFGAIWDS